MLISILVLPLSVLPCGRTQYYARMQQCDNVTFSVFSDFSRLCRLYRDERKYLCISVLTVSCIPSPCLWRRSPPLPKGHFSLK